MLKTQKTNRLNAFSAKGVDRNLVVLMKLYKTCYRTRITALYYLNLFSLVRLSLFQFIDYNSQWFHQKHRHSLFATLNAQ